MIQAPEVNAARELELRRAILDTVRYAALFDYPLRSDEIHWGLINLPATRDEVRHALESDLELRRVTSSVGEFVVLAGSEALPERRHRLADRHDRMIAGHRRRLRLLARLPWLRLLAFSGGTAHKNSPEREDIDLFVVTERGRLFSVYAGIIVLSRLLRTRHLYCANYLVDANHLAFAARDLYTANQLIHLRPLERSAIVTPLWNENRWIETHFPNARPRPPERLWRTTDIERTAQRTIELLLWPVAWLLEAAARGVLLGRLRRKRALAPLSDVLLESGRLKLHFKDLKRATLRRFVEGTARERLEP